MLKKLLLLSVVFAGCNAVAFEKTSNPVVDNDQAQAPIVIQNTLNDIITQNDKQTKTILGTLGNETKFAGVAMGCHTVTLLGGIALYHYMIHSYIPSHYKPAPTAESLMIVRDLTIKALCFAGIAPMSLLAGNKLTNSCYKYMDPQESHKTAHLVGFGSAIVAINALDKILTK